MSENRIKLAPDTVAYADGETHKLVVEFAIPERHGYRRCKDPGRQHPLDSQQGTSSTLQHWL